MIEIKHARQKKKTTMIDDKHPIICYNYIMSIGLYVCCYFIICV